MKKSMITMLPLLLALHLPFCPFKYLPHQWVENYLYARKWTQLVVTHVKILSLGAPEPRAADVRTHRKTPRS